MELQKNLWLIEISLGLLAIFCSNWALKKIILRYRAGAHEGQGWRFKLDQIVFAPLRLVLWMLGISYVLTVLSFHFGIFESAAFFIHVRNAAIVFSLAWMVLRWKKIALAQLLAAHHPKHDPGTLQVIFKLITAVIAILATLITLQIFGVNIMPLLAFGGIGAAAVGFAAKDFIANFFGGFMLFVNRPFIEGDEIYLCQEQIEGHVEKIGWHLTTVRDKNKCPVYLPNALFSKAFVVNRSRRSHWCIEETLDICYEDAANIPKLTDDLRHALTRHPEIDPSQSVLVGIATLGDYALQISVKMYTHGTSEEAYIRIRQQVLLQINAIVETHGLEMPLPTQAIKMVTADKSTPEPSFT